MVHLPPHLHYRQIDYMHDQLGFVPEILHVIGEVKIKQKEDMNLTK